MTKKQYRIYIDESGDHGLNNVDDPSHQYLGLTGCIIEQEYYRTVFHLAFEALKQQHFPYNPDDPVIFHRRDMIDMKGPFWRLRDQNYSKRFEQALLHFLAQQNYHLITVVIDKKANKDRYGAAVNHPYHYCLTAMLERYCGFLNFYNAQGDVMVEARGKAEDNKLQSAYATTYGCGTYYRSPAFFQRTLTSKDLKLKQKAANIAGLQLADILAYECKHDILQAQNLISRDPNCFGEEICQCIEDKYNRRFATGQVKGYGKVFIK